MPPEAALLAPPLADVIVRIDGRRVARSGLDGEARLLLPEAPTTIQIDREGWRVLGLTPFSDGRYGRHDTAVWMVPDE